MEDGEAERKPVRVFVAWDSQDKIPRKVLERYVGGHKQVDGFVLDVPMRSSRSTDGSIGPQIRARIDRSDRCAALIAEPNANVAYEAGLALGLGKLLVLSSTRAERKRWTKASPVRGQLQPTTTKGRDIIARLTEGIGVQVAPFEPGKATLFLCPDEGGDQYREHVSEHKTLGWRLLDLGGQSWSLEELPARLAGVGRVVWAITDCPDGQERDGDENTANALIAGYAEACGCELVVWKDEMEREIADVEHRLTDVRDFDHFVELVENVAARPIQVALPIDPDDHIGLYRQHVQQAHSRLVPFFSGTQNRTLGEIHVDLAIERLDLGEGRGLERLQQNHTLAELLDLPFDRDAHHPAASTGAWIVRGDPGAGKSTSTRHVAATLAADPDGPVPIYVPLVQWARSPGVDVFEFTERDCANTCGHEPVRGLASELRELARKGRVWLLLDGLDEVGDADATATYDRLRACVESEDLRTCPVVVTSRPIGLADIHPKFRVCDLRPLDHTAAKRLLDNWIGPAAAEETWRKIQASPRLPELARNPLLLTLLARIALEQADQGHAIALPATRIELYRQAVELLLQKGQSREHSEGVKDWRQALAVLPPLCLRLAEHLAGQEAWPEADVHEQLNQVRDADPVLDKRIGRVWDSNQDFLSDLTENAGLFGPVDGPKAPWKFPHRSLREYLVAEALKCVGVAAALQRAEQLVVKGEDGKVDDEATAAQVGHWGEPFALLAGLLPAEDALALVRELPGANRRLAERALVGADGVPLEARLAVLLALDEWDPEVLGDMVAVAVGTGAETVEAVARLLTAQVSPEAALDAAAHLHYALERALAERADEPLRDAFFDAWGRPRRPVPENWKFASVPATPPRGFLMGTPADEEPLRDAHVTREQMLEWQRTHEVQHLVHLRSGFRLGQTPVTIEQFRLLAPDHESREAGELPVANVSWYEALLFARWLRADLPTEAEWEWACREDTTTRFWSGDAEEDLDRVGWYFKNSNLSRQPVAQKEPTAHSLYDMHGNVREWCRDWFGPYEVRDEGVVDPPGALRGSARVMRGGSYWDGARGCRSAFRNWVGPTNRDGGLGFRLRLPLPSSDRSSTLDP